MAQNSVTQPFDMLGFANALLRGVVQSERDIAKGQRERRLLREQRLRLAARSDEALTYSPSNPEERF